MLLPRFSRCLSYLRSSRSSVIIILQRSSCKPSFRSLSKPTFPHSQLSLPSRFPVRRFADGPAPPSSTLLGPLKRAQKFIQDNPFTKFSLALCAIVLGLSMAVELYNRFKKKKIPVVIVYPPCVGHYTVQRMNEVAEIDRKLKTVARQEGYPIVYVTGPAGAGKTELVCQYVSYFTETSSKWFGLRSVKPTVLYLNGRSEKMLKLSLNEAAIALGIKNQPTSTSQSLIDNTLTVIREKLVANNLPWLIVVDEMDSDIASTFHSSLSKLFVDQQQWWGGGPTGSVVVTTRKENAVPKNYQVEIQQSLTKSDGLKMLSEMSGLLSTNQDPTQEQQMTELLEELQCFPLAIALAASTIKIYQSFLEADGGPSISPITTYHDILKQTLKEKDLIKATLTLYLEAALSDPRFRHTFDLLGSCELSHPVPAALVLQHLSHPFYEIPEESLLPPQTDPMEKIKELTGDLNANDDSYLGQIKNMLPFFGKKPPTQAEIASILAAGEDGVSYLHESPLFSFKSYKKSGFEQLQVHSCAQEELPQLFSRSTAPLMDNKQVLKDEEQFNQTAWFRAYRTFNHKQSLDKYHRSLPGISAPGVMTNDEYLKHPPLPLRDPTLGTTTTGELDYYEYQHIVSHYHRVVASLSSLLKTAGGDIEDAQLRKYLQPHLEAVSSYPLISRADRATCSYGLVSIESALSPPSEEIFQKYSKVLEEQRDVFGSKSECVARTITDLADVKFSMNDVAQARELLEESLQIYEKITSKVATSEFPFEVGLTLSSLAIVYSELGDKEKCKDLLERALGAYQTLPSNGKVMKRQRKLVSRSLTDVAHAYLSLGNLTMAKKYIDLSVMAHQNLYFEPHSETVRTLNVSSIVYAMLGDKTESHKQRLEAGKVTSKLDDQPMLV